MLDKTRFLIPSSPKIPWYKVLSRSTMIAFKVGCKKLGRIFSPRIWANFTQALLLSLLAFISKLLSSMIRFSSKKGFSILQILYSFKLVLPSKSVMIGVLLMLDNSCIFSLIKSSTFFYNCLNL
ncbi:TPA: hypothetical protein ACWR2B_000407 [Campylobacter lari]|nr:hypothetical protein [Campylobacter lari]MCR2071440.1 hypothetical protein [Campylobacter lari subsp. concheus]